MKVNKNKGLINKNKKTNKELGITLIALVITIIVLLILAGVAIASLTGENGLFGRATAARDEHKRAEYEEELKLIASQLAIEKAQDDTLVGDKYLEEYAKAILTDEKLKNKVEVYKDGKLYTLASIKIKALQLGEVKTQAELQENKLTVTTKEEGFVFEITETQGVRYAGKTNEPEGEEKEPPTPQKSTLEQAIENRTVFGKKTTVEDKYGNKVVVPENFKIIEGTDVTQGVVIEDASTDSTKGSQFVWIQVGDVKTENETKTIKLSRYTFAEDGTEKDEGAKTITSDSYSFEENLIGNGNGVADTEVFSAFTSKTEDGNTKTKVEKTGGYYIGRYEARANTERTAKTDDDNLAQITEKGSDNVYNYVTQPQASKLSKEMYTGKSFKSDLMNSYAWDTAIVFIQKCSGDRNYSRQNSLNTGSLAPKRTNNLSSDKQDKICNIWDMASNCLEWSTETLSNADIPCTFRGGRYKSSSCTSGRYYGTVTNSFDDYSFRPLLIM